MGSETEESYSEEEDEDVDAALESTPTSQIILSMEVSITCLVVRERKLTFPISTGYDRNDLGGKGERC